MKKQTYKQNCMSSRLEKYERAKSMSRLEYEEVRRRKTMHDQV